MIMIDPINCRKYKKIIAVRIFHADGGVPFLRSVMPFTGVVEHFTEPSRKGRLFTVLIQM